MEIGLGSPTSGVGSLRAQLSGRCSSNLPGAVPKKSMADDQPITEPATPSECRSGAGSLELGARLGGTNTNVVYQGMLNGSPVAARLIRHEKSYTRTYESLELYMQKNVFHPNLVRIIAVHTGPAGSKRNFGHRPSDVSFRDSLSSYFRRSTSSDVFSEMARHLPQHRRSVGRDEEMETCIIMEYCDRSSLALALSAGLCWKDTNPNYRIVNFRTVLTIAVEIARALAHLHSFGIIHGDLKPENVLLQRSKHSSMGFTCKVGDFGLSRLIAPVSSVETFSIGTVSHQPPELLEKGLLTPEADVFAFGMVLWELVAGQGPFKGKHPSIIEASIVKGYRPRIPLSWPVWYTQLVRSCWSQDRRKRPEFSLITQHLELVLNHMKEVRKHSLDDVRRKSSVDDSHKSPRGIGVRPPQSAGPSKLVPGEGHRPRGPPSVAAQKLSDLGLPCGGATALPVLREESHYGSACSPRPQRNGAYPSPRSAMYSRSPSSARNTPHVSATMRSATTADPKYVQQRPRMESPGVATQTGGCARAQDREQQTSDVQGRVQPPAGKAPLFNQRLYEAYLAQPARTSSLSSVSESLDLPHGTRLSGVFNPGRNGHAPGSSPRNSSESQNMDTQGWVPEDVYLKVGRGRCSSSSLDRRRSSASMEYLTSPRGSWDVQPVSAQPVTTCVPPTPCPHPSTSVNILVYGGAEQPLQRKPRVVSHNFASLSAPRNESVGVNNHVSVSASLHFDRSKLRAKAGGVPVLSDMPGVRGEPKITNPRQHPGTAWRQRGH